MSTAKITLTEANGTEHDITDATAFMYDAIVQSLDWGSGFLDLEEQLHIALVGVLAGYEVPEVIPLEDWPVPSQRDYTRDAAGMEKYDAAMKEWRAGYGHRARAAILDRLRIFDMAEEAK